MSLFSRYSRAIESLPSPFHPVGFHGDKYLLSFVGKIMMASKVFVETGTHVGSTLAYVARTYPHLHCLSCEPNTKAFQRAINNTRHLSNVSIYNLTSIKFMQRLKTDYPHLFKGRGTMFWLDAHGLGFEWPLRQEIEFITKRLEAAYILIDDFKVPGMDCFGYDEYGSQECSFDYIKNDLNPELEYRLYYPQYDELTSKHHPLRGWSLIEFGHGDELEVPYSLQDKLTCLKIENL